MKIVPILIRKIKKHRL